MPRVISQIPALLGMSQPRAECISCNYISVKECSSNVRKTTAKSLISCWLGKSACKKKKKEESWNFPLQDQRIIKEEGDLGSSLVQPPAESRVSQEARPNFSELYTVRSLQPPRMEPSQRCLALSSTAWPYLPGECLSLLTGQTSSFSTYAHSSLFYHAPLRRSWLCFLDELFSLCVLSPCKPSLTPSSSNAGHWLD